MIEEKKPLYPFLLTARCENCSSGELKSSGRIFEVYPEQHEHICSFCGAKKSLPEKYPSVEFEDKDGNKV